MTTRYAPRFNDLKAQGQQGFIPFSLLGWPTVEDCKTLLKVLVDSQPAALELGIPFSDPVADGPTIQHAMTQALDHGMTVDTAFDLIRYARSLDDELPIGLLVYYNLILARGSEAFIAECAAAGVDGLLVPDLPPELAQELHPLTQQYGLDLIFIVSPLTDPDRLAELLPKAGGFLYVVSRLGITGATASYDSQLAQLMAGIKTQTDLPLYVGFGISTPEQARQMVQAGADGYITASAMIDQINHYGPATMTEYLPPYLAAMKAVGQG
jgi:tryptophan synthase alpha chain